MSTSRSTRAGGEFCTVSVTDTGAGMPRGGVAGGEPFFTAKPLVRTTDSVCRASTALPQAGGWMSITSQVGLGTTVTLYCHSPIIRRTRIRISRRRHAHLVSVR